MGGLPEIGRVVGSVVWWSQEDDLVRARGLVVTGKPKTLTTSPTVGERYYYPHSA